MFSVKILGKTITTMKIRVCKLVKAEVFHMDMKCAELVCVSKSVQGMYS